MVFSGKVESGKLRTTNKIWVQRFKQNQLSVIIPIHRTFRLCEYSGSRMGIIGYLATHLGGIMPLEHYGNWNYRTTYISVSRKPAKAYGYGTNS